MGFSAVGSLTSFNAAGGGCDVVGLEVEGNVGHGSVGARGTVVVWAVVALDVVAAFTFDVTATTAGAEKYVHLFLLIGKRYPKKANLSEKRCKLDKNLM